MRRYTDYVTLHQAQAMHLVDVIFNMPVAAPLGNLRPNGYERKFAVNGVEEQGLYYEESSTDALDIAKHVLRFLVEADRETEAKIVQDELLPYLQLHEIRDRIAAREDKFFERLQHAENALRSLSAAYFDYRYTVDKFVRQSEED